jgi:hypothetical protein
MTLNKYAVYYFHDINLYQRWIFSGHVQTAPSHTEILDENRKIITVICGIKVTKLIFFEALAKIFLS